MWADVSDEEADQEVIQPLEPPPEEEEDEGEEEGEESEDDDDAKENDDDRPMTCTDDSDDAAYNSDSDASVEVPFETPRVIKRLCQQAIEELYDLASKEKINDGTYSSMCKKLKTIHDSNRGRDRVVIKTERRIAIEYGVDNAYSLISAPPSVHVMDYRFLRDLFAARRNSHMDKDHAEWFETFLEFACCFDHDTDTGELSGDLEMHEYTIVTLLRALRYQDSDHTELTLDEGCNWLVDWLITQKAHASLLFDTNTMRDLYMMSSKNQYILNYLLATANCCQERMLRRLALPCNCASCRLPA